MGGILLLLLSSPPMASAEEASWLMLSPFRWPPSAIPVYIDPEGPEFARRATERAMELWNRAQDWFLANYSYMLNNRPIPYKFYLTSSPGAKSISVYFRPYTNPDTLGVTRGTPPYVDITIFLVTGDGKPITELAVQNIALKELGRALGMGDASLQRDPMYGYSLPIENMTLVPSTLDLYALYVISSGLSKTYMGTEYVLTLPSHIPYEMPPIGLLLPLNVTRTIILGQ